MSSDVAIRARDLSKRYFLYDRPEDRLKQSIVPRLERLIGRTPRQYYREFAALDRVSFEVGRGETVGIIGRNGSGKSTLLQIICGTLQPSSGHVEVNGRIAALLELGAGFNPEFTGRENAYLNGAILGLARAELDARFDDIAAFADIGTFIDQPVKTYSSGMYVRLAFAVAVCVDPDILVVDEALAVGDEAFQRKCYARIEQIQERGGTILFVSHGAQTIVQLCSRALLIDGGELLLDGRPKTVVSQYQRLVNASPAAAPQIRAALTEMRDAGTDVAGPAVAAATKVGDVADANGHAVEMPDALAAPADANGRYADYYDPGLVSQSTVSLEERGARIRDARIVTLRGERVNVLQSGRRYLIEYWTDFSRDAKHVGFGFGLTTKTGLHVSGAKCRACQLEHVSTNTAQLARFEFSCILLGGTYFLTCHVRGQQGGEEMTLHRIADAVMFRVTDDYDLIPTGIVDLSVVPTLRHR